MSDVCERVKEAVVGVAGLGGLGSMVSQALVRLGVGKLVLVDFDKVEAANLSRQAYFADQVGEYKVDATVDNLRRISAKVQLEGVKLKLTAESIVEVFNGVDVVVECFDIAEAKRMLVETVLTKMAATVVVSASGVAGYGNSNAIVTRNISDRFVLVGDGSTAIGDGVALTAARVWIAACHEANAVAEILIGI